jgi:hypothetical protein
MPLGERLSAHKEKIRNINSSLIISGRALRLVGKSGKIVFSIRGFLIFAFKLHNPLTTYVIIGFTPSVGSIFGVESI